MKKSVVILLLILFSASSFSQNSLAIVDTSNLWTYLDYMPWYPSYKESYYVKFSGDTLINQTNYLRIWQTNTSNPSAWGMMGFTRADDNGHVYMRNNIGEEGLAYRFDVNPGDTFTLSNPFHSYTFVAEVLDVDSILLEPSGIYRKRVKITDFEWSGLAQEEYWIEGIGCLAGILFSGHQVYSYTGSVYLALCQWQNDNLVYSNPSWNYCMVPVSTPEIEDESIKIEVRPNPLAEYSEIIIKGLNGSGGKLEIRNSIGNLVYQYPLLKNRNLVIYKDDLISGLYIISLIENNSVITQRKLIIQ